MKNKKLKSLLQTKQKIISRESGHPSLSSGKDGDLQIRRIDGQGIFLFYKWANKWYSARLSQHRPRTSENKEPVKIPLGVEPSSLGSIAMDTDGLIKVRKTKSNKSQLVSYNSSNTLDIAEIKTSRSSTTGMSGEASGNSDLHLLNTTGHTTLHLEARAANFDPFIIFSSRQVGETPNLFQWVLGMENNADDFMLLYKSADSEPLTPSTSTSSYRKDKIDTFYTIKKTYLTGFQ